MEDMEELDGLGVDLQELNPQWFVRPLPNPYTLNPLTLHIKPCFSSSLLSSLRLSDTQVYEP